MGQFHRRVDIPGFYALDPLRNVVVQRTGPFADGVLSAFQAACRLAVRLLCAKRQIDFIEIVCTRLRAELIRLAARREGLHLLDFGVR
ncbi:hypothetical protein D3C71_1865010 [compost metagenome]